MRGLLEMRGFLETLLLVVAMLACTAWTLPDDKLTPGAIEPSWGKAELCSPHWLKNHPRAVTEAMKKEVTKLYGLSWDLHSTFEYDHLISRELGGADSVQNLWPEPLPEAKLKDKIENSVHRDLCRGKIDLKTAQERVKTWFLENP